MEDAGAFTPDTLRSLYAAITLDPVQEGAWFERVLQEHGLSEAQLARHIDRPRSYIQQRRALLRAAPIIQIAVQRRLLSFSQVRGVCAGAGDDHERQRRALQAVLRRLRAGDRLTEDQCRRLADQ